MGDLVIRDAREEDHAVIAAITHRAYGEYATAMEPSAWRALEGAVHAALASSEPCDRIVAERDGEIAGSVMLFAPAVSAYGEMTGSAPWPELRMLAVSPESRGLGVARALVDECIRRARAMGATALGLHTSRSMRAAMALYRRMGFERDPQRDFRPEGAEIVEGYVLRL